MRIRIRYSINGKIRFISHLDLMRAFFRACIKKDIPVAVSQGFSPHLKISFGPPLSVGMTSSDEYLDMYMSKSVDLNWVKSTLQEGLPSGIKIEDTNEVSKDEPSLSSNLNRAVYKVKIPACARLRLAHESVQGEALHMDIIDGQLVMDMPIGRPIDMISKLWPEVGLEELKLWKIHRERLYHA